MLRSDLSTKLILSGILVPLLLLFSGFSMAFNSGGWSGNGGDLHKGSDNPWFLGNTPVRYCIERSQDFSFSREQLQLTVAEAFELWESFFRKYGMHNLTMPPVFPGSDSPKIHFPDGQPRGLTLQFNLSECQLGDTSQMAENHLYFLFGTSNDLVEQYKKLNEESALGVALRPSFRHDTYRNSGIIWLSNFTEQRARLLHLILHEVGHIFGMPHDSVFVMSRDIAYMLTDDEQFTDEFFGRIESFFWPYKLRVGDEVLLTSRRGFRGPPPAPLSTSSSRRPREHRTCQGHDFRPNQHLPADVLRMLRVRPDGCHKISLVKTSDGLSPVPDKKSYYRLEIVSDKGKIWSYRAVFTNHFPPSGGREKFKGPTLFTGWTHADDMSGKQYWLPLPLDLSANWWHSSGYLEIKKGKTFAAKLNFEAGPFLEIYLPSSKTWWLLKSLPDFEKKAHPIPGHFPPRRMSWP